tara:strand:- start:1152 stop:2648 length:1497 start_codon:yes stop_codon:yes gene_type:complete
VGIFSSIFGKKEKTKSTQETQYELPDWVEQTGRENIGLGNFLTEGLMPTEAPTERVAGFTDDQLGMFEGVRGLSGTTGLDAQDLGQDYYRGFADRSPYTMAKMGGIPQIGGIGDMQTASMNAAQLQNVDDMGAAQLRGVGDVSAQNAAAGMSNYQNQYEDQVVDAVMANLGNVNERNQAMSDMNASAAGAFGGSRHGVRDAQVADDYARNAASTLSGLRSQGFNTSAQLSAADANRALQATQGNQATQASQAQQQASLDQQAAQVNQAARIAQAQQQGMFDQQAAQQNAMMQQQGYGSQFDFAGQQAMGDADLTQAGRMADMESRYRSDAQRMNAVGAWADSAANAEQMNYDRDVQRLDMLGNIGGQQQVQDQNVMDVPYDALAFRGAQLGMNPYPTSVSQQGFSKTTKSPSPFKAAAQVALATGFCWVAREVYGADNPKWLQFREWVLYEAPAWFRNFYIKHGERIAAFISDKPLLKWAIRRWMDTRIEGKVSYGLA